MELPSTKPYLLRAIWEWCCDNGFTPYLSVVVDSRTRVPQEFVRDGQIVLNLGPDATNRLQIGNEFIEFQARFGGVARELSIPVGQVDAIYARENNAGMAFEIDEVRADVSVENPAEELAETSAAAKGPGLQSVITTDGEADSGSEPPTPPTRPEGGRPHLQRIK